MAKPDTRTTVTSPEKAPSGDLCLCIVSGSALGRHTLPPSGELVLGRSGDADIVLPDHGVSRRHARVHIGPPLTIEDLGSANGTFVRGQRLEPRTRVELAEGDAARIGKATVLVQRLGDDHDQGPLPLVAGEPAMRAVMATAEHVARSKLPVLIVGETGVGKEVLAQLIHRRSPRASAPFVCLNCAALPDALLESELFGHERGAFTGADRVKPGLLETAHGGTVFLDELAELPLGLQAKLLRVVETQQIMRVGGLEPRTIDVRFVAATNRDLEAEVAAGRFREDLFYRLNGVVLELPPLRERTSEIPDLVRVFTDEACQRDERRRPVWSAAAQERLVQHRWAGNIRELRNVVERAIVLCDGDLVDVQHLPDLSAPDARSATAEEANLRSRLEQLDRRRIEDALARTGGNQTRAARLLGIARNTLIARMKAYGLLRRPGSG